VRLDFHFNREKALWDYWRKVIEFSSVAQSYASVVSVIAPVLLTALTPVVKHAGINTQVLLFIISLHLAITMGIYRALRVERLIQNGLKFESEFYELFYYFQDRIGEFDDSQMDRVNKYLIRYAELRKNAYAGESQGIPEIRREGV